MKEKLNDRIIEILLKNNRFLTAEEIALQLNVNEKTVRRRISLLKNEIGNGESQIISKKGKGYKINVLNQERIDDPINVSLMETDGNLPSNRRAKIFETIASHKGISPEALMREIYISESTLKHDVKVLNRYSENVNVQIRLTQNSYTIEGHEYYIRNTLLRLIYDSSLAKKRRKNAGKEKRVLVSEIQKVFLEMEFLVDKHTLDAIVNYMSVSSERIRRGQIINHSEGYEIEESNLPMLLAVRLHRILAKMIHQSLPESETLFFAYFLTSVLPVEELNNEYSKSQYYYQALRLTAIVYQTLNYIGIDYLESIGSEYDFIVFFTGLCMRVDLDIQRRLKLYREIEITHALSYCIAEVVFAQIEKAMDQTISKEEVAYFSLILNYYFFATYQHKKAIAILPSDYTVARIYQRDLQHSISKEIQFMTLSEFKKQRDLEISAMIISPFDKDVITPSNNDKFLRISEIITEDNIKRVIRVLTYRNHKKLINNLSLINDDKPFRDTNASNTQFNLTYLNSIIRFVKDPKLPPIQYGLVDNIVVSQLIIIINSAVSSDEVIDLIRVSADLAKIYDREQTLLEKEKLVKHYL